MTDIIDGEFADAEQQIARGKLNPEMNPRSTHQGQGRGRDDDDNPTRAMAAIALRLGGAGYETIAAQLGYASARRVRDVVERALADSVSDTDDIPRMRKVQHARLERMLTSIWTRAINPKDPDHLAYSARALAIIDRENKMLGIDLPQQISVSHTPDLQEVESWLKGMAERVHGVVAVEEAEILEIEAGQSWTDDPR